MKILFLPGNHKFPYEALKLLYNKAVEIVGCIIDDKNEYYKKMFYFCQNHNIHIFTTEELYASIDKLDIDVAYSVFFPKIIKKPIIDNCKIGCINFHPAPLPQYRGLASMCFGVLNKMDYWEITAHYIEDETLDTGKVLLTKRITVGEKDTPHNIEEKLYAKEVEIFEEVTDLILKGKLQSIKAYYPEGKNHYYSKKDFLQARKIDLIHDNSEMIDKKVRAFWFPKTAGVARIEIKGKEYGLIDMDIMQEIKAHYIVDD